MTGSAVPFSPALRAPHAGGLHPNRRPSV